MQLLGNLDVRSFVMTSRLIWICHIKRMDSKRQESRVFNNNPPGSRLRGPPNKRWRNCVKHILVVTKLDIGKVVQKTNLTGRSPLRTGKSALSCNAI